jgi:hypothetical protein
MIFKSAQYLALVAANISGVLAQGGLFIVQCGPLTTQRADPIIFPGQISPHVHAIVGGTAFSLQMTNEEARRSKSTTCNKMLDKSNYWQPQLYHQGRDGKFELIKLLGIVRTIRNFPELLLTIELRMHTISIGLATINTGAKTAMELRGPSRLQRDFGWSWVVRLGGKSYNDYSATHQPLSTLNRNYDASNPEHRAISHVCLDPGQDTIELRQAPCAEMRAQTYFPSCWNGRDLDSPDHKSHVCFFAEIT